MTLVPPGFAPVTPGYTSTMTAFSATTESEAVITADRSEVWRVLTDPGTLPQLTPMLERIEADGDRWRWEMSRIPVLRAHVAPAFTERMTFKPEERIEFTHEPPDGGRERAAVEGFYDLEEVEQGTRLHIKLEMCVDLPLPRAAKRLADRVMARVITHMGDRFAANLLRHLDAEEVKV